MVIGLITLVMGIISIAGGRFDNSLVFLVEKIAISIILAVSLSLVVGFLGELSLGHAGFMCVGAYLGGKISVLLVPVLGNGILAFLIALVVGCAAAALCGVIIGIPALRLRGDYLAIVTLAFGEIIKNLLNKVDTLIVAGGMAYINDKLGETADYEAAFAINKEALFSEHEISDEQRKAVDEYAQKVLAECKNNWSLWQKIKNRFVKFIY